MSDVILQQILTELQGVKSEIKDIKSDVRSLQAEFGTLRSDFNTFKSEVVADEVIAGRDTLERIDRTLRGHDATLDILARRSIDHEAELKRLSASA